MMKSKIEKITFALALIFLLCYFTQVCNFPNILTVGGGAALCLILFMCQKKVRIDAGICFVSVAFFSHFYILQGKSALTMILVYIPLIMYVLGNYLGGYVKGQKNGELKYRWIILTLSAGYTIHGILNSYMYFAGHRAKGARQWADFWLKGHLPGTQHVIYYLPALALLFPAIAYCKKRKLESVLIGIASVFFCYVSLVTKSRMSIVILAAVFFVQAVLYVIFEWNEVKSKVKDRKFRIAGLILLALIVVGIILIKDTPIVVKFIKNMSKDGGILNNVRFQFQREVLQNLPKYPMGAMELDFNYAHNMWLDMAKRTGIIPFAFMACYTILTVIDMLRMLFCKRISVEMKLMTVGVYGAFFLYLSVEPALEASMHYLIPWIFVGGLCHGVLSKEKSLYEKN